MPDDIQVRIRVELIRLVKGRVRRVTFRQLGPYDAIGEQAAAAMATADCVRDLARTYSPEKGGKPCHEF